MLTTLDEVMNSGEVLTKMYGDADADVPLPS